MSRSIILLILSCCSVQAVSQNLVLQGYQEVLTVSIQHLENTRLNLQREQKQLSTLLTSIKKSKETCNNRASPCFWQGKDYQNMASLNMQVDVLETAVKANQRALNALEIELDNLQPRRDAINWHLQGSE